MKKYFAIFAIATLIISSCKKDKNIEESAPVSIPLEKAIIGKWIEYQTSNGSSIPANSAMEYHFQNDSMIIFKDNSGQSTFVCNAKYSINKFIYPETLGYLQIVGIPGECNTSQLLNLKMISINDSNFIASISYYTGNPPNYFIDVVSKYRKFQ